MTPLAQSMNSALLHFVWQGIAVGLLLWIALARLRDRSANARYAASCIALGVLAVAPVVTASLVYTTNVEYSSAITETFDASVLKSPVGASAVKFAAPWSFSEWRVWVLPVWGVGVLLFAFRLMWSWGHTSALRREGGVADSSLLVVASELARRVGVKPLAFRTVISSVVDVPSVVGWMKPVLLLPVATVTGLTPEQFEALLVHELAHIRRHDYLVNVLQSMIETLFFYHPVVWWVSSRMRYERELCCDDLAVRTLGDAVVYVHALTKLEELRVVRPSLAMGAARGPLLRRIERLIGGKRREEGPSSVAFAIALAAGILCVVALNVGWAQGRPENPQTGDQGITPWFAPVPSVPPMPPSRLASSASWVPQPPRTSLLLPPSPSASPLRSPSTASPGPAPTPPLPPSTATLAVRATGGLGLQDTPQRIPGVLRTRGILVLFRGDAVISNSDVTDTDMAQARTARLAAGGGDLLWFRVEGRCCPGSTTEPFMVQDKAVLDRVNQLQIQIETENRKNRPVEEGGPARQQAEVNRENAASRSQAEANNVLRAELELEQLLRALVRSQTARPAQ